ncbi:MAG: TetR/AcrR family transcriptional regulator [Clostridiales bacterium]|nr:TetR/AcrR family transcriptional regulator [Clostridiales bacterium]
MESDLKTDILKATIKVFNKKGLKLTMDDVAVQMGISKKTIYKFYDSKEEIFDKIVDYIFDGIKEREKEILEEEGLSLEQRARKLLAAFPESYTEIDFTKLGDLKDKYPKIYKKLYKRLDSGWEPTIELLEEGRRQGLYRQDADFTIFKIMMDASVARFFETDTLRKAKISYVDALNQVVDILLTGIKA